MHAQFDAAAIVEFHDESLSRKQWLGGAGRPVPHGTWLSIDASKRLSSETAGAMIDRLSILALKIFHMREQTRRPEAGPAHIDTCRARLQRLTIQRHDLACCLDRLLAETRQGQACFKVYRQFKMYNDPSLNPYFYGGAGAGAAQ